MKNIFRQSVIFLFIILLEVFPAFPTGTANSAELTTVVFRRVQEPRENAFSILIPKGWQIEGGIFRIDPTMQGGAAQSIAAGQMRLYLPGSNYNGMTVYPIMSAGQFMQQLGQTKKGDLVNEK